MLLTAFTKALRNMLLPGVMKIFLLCLAVYAAGWGALSWMSSVLINAYIGVTGVGGIITQFIGSAGGMVVAWFLFPLLYPVLISLFHEKIVRAIERADYPHLPPAKTPSSQSLFDELRFSLKAIGLNLLCLPFYLVPMANLTVYYALNGYLLGAQFFALVASSHVNREEAVALQKRARRSILLAGVIISFAATVPVLNFVVPVLGFAAMLHFFHSLRGKNEKA